MESLKSFASKILFQDAQELIPASYRERDICSVCLREVSPHISEPVLILTCRHFFHLGCVEGCQVTEPCCSLCESRDKENEIKESLPLMSLKRLESEDAMRESEYLEEIEPIQESNESQVTVSEDEPVQPIEESTQESMSDVFKSFEEAESTRESDVQVISEDESAQPSELQASTVLSGEESSPSVRKDSARSVSASRKQKMIEGLLQELIAPPDETEPVSVDEDQGDTSVGKNLARLYMLASAARDRMILSNQDEIRCWYNYSEEFESRVDEMSRSEGITDKTARTRVYEEITPHLSGVKRGSLRTKTYKARNIYRLFREIGTNRIGLVKSYSVDFISSLTVKQISSITCRVLGA